MKAASNSALVASHEPERFFQHLGPTALGQTEFADPRQGLLDHVRPVWNAVCQFSPSDLRARQSRIQAISFELGLSTHASPAPQVDDTHWQLDLLPRIIDPLEWAELEKGLIQRARAFNLFIADVYGRQNILHDRVIAPGLVFDDPAYHWECLGLPNPTGHFLVNGAVDLVRDLGGRWFATQNHFSTPVGASFAIQYRRTLTQAFPEIFQATDIRPVSSYSTDLVEALSNLSTEAAPHVVMLALGGSPDAWFEESFLARRMGVAMVKPADLLVRGDRVFLKTIAGLEKIDVIYRRVESASVDPIAFGARGARGIPGLVNCVRKGTVIIANALGSGIADNKALLPHSDTIIRYYLNEEPLLRTVTTYHCADRDQREYVRDNLEDILLKPIHREREVHGLLQSHKSGEYREQMIRLLNEQPELVVAQPFVDASSLPRFENGRFVTRPAYLRAFVVLGDSPSVMPGGLTRQALDHDPFTRIADLVGGAKDTWIPAGQAGSGTRRIARRRRPATKVREFRIGSRVAESLYWMGRYGERAEHTARMVRVMEEVGWTQLNRRDKLNIWPLWQAVAASTGREDVLKITSPPSQIQDLSQRLVADQEDPASLFSCIRLAHANASGIREFITPEVWIIYNRFITTLDRSTSQNASTLRGHTLDLCQYTIDECSCLYGSFARTMPHDDGWQFYRLGLLLERAISTTTVLDIVLASALEHADPASPTDPDLTTLLRLLGSLDAYQREYRARTLMGPVAELLWKNRETPSSVAFCLRHAVSALHELLGGMRTEYRKPLVLAERIGKSLAGQRSSSLFPDASTESDMPESSSAAQLEVMRSRFEKYSGRLKAQLALLHEQIEDTFLSHQIPRGRS
ncbi:MAG: circularly permuted type 2 ATP-grasp protein [Candidatus Methylacidiphilales bacterium]|nr:circularly permuted type 2 ATP-grasp protein [Candidatus Methylacidiphilales bacterium]